MCSKLIRLLAYFTFLSGLLYCSPLKGQVKDAGLWTSVGLDYKLKKKVTVSISEEVRFNENITEAGTILTNVGLSYKYNKHFKFDIGYRYSLKRKVEDYYSIRHRFNVDIRYNKSLKPIQFQYRIRLQDQYSNIGRDSDGGIPEFYLRNKLKLNLDLNKPYSPYFSVELFSPLNYPHNIAFDRIRTIAGVDYSLSKHHKVDVYYLIQKGLNVSRPKTDFVLGLGYVYKM